MLLVDAESAQQLAGGGAAALLSPRLAAGLGAATALLGLLLRRRLPPGIAEGVGVAGASGAALLLLAFDTTGVVAGTTARRVLALLAVLWCMLGSAGARRAAREGCAEPAGAGGEVRDGVWFYGVLLCGAAALAGVLAAGGPLRSWGWSAAETDLALLLLCAGAGWVLGAGTWTRYATLAVVAIVLERLVSGLHLLTGGAGVMGMNALALGSLVIVVGALLLRWWRRRRAWIRDPASAPGSPATPRLLFAVLVGVAALAGLGVIVLRESGWAPPAAAFAALTCLTAGHVAGWLVAGETGLILVGVFLVTGWTAWVEQGWGGAVPGLALAGGYLLWLARFWEQQLNDGQAWTTAGSLIPVARRLACVAYVGTLPAAVCGSLMCGSDTQPVWQTLVTSVLLLGGVEYLVRDSAEHPTRGTPLAGCAALLAAVNPTVRLIVGVTGCTLWPMVVIAGGAPLLALRVGRLRLPPAIRAVYAAHAGGAAPLGLLLAVGMRGLDLQSVVAAVLAAVSLLGVLTLNRADSFRRGPGRNGHAAAVGT